jgi:hypothetical protein
VNAGDASGDPGRGDPTTTRRRLMRQALGLVPLVRDRLESDEGDERQASEAGGPAKRGYRTYREGVADLRRRERAAAAAPPGQPAPRTAPRTWREGAAEVDARERGG